MRPVVPSLHVHDSWNELKDLLIKSSNICRVCFFARYVRDMLASVASCGIGCNVGGMFINILAYADDVVLLAPSWRGLQQLLDIVVQQCTQRTQVSLHGLST